MGKPFIIKNFNFTKFHNSMISRVIKEQEDATVDTRVYTEDWRTGFSNGLITALSLIAELKIVLQKEEAKQRKSRRKK